MVQDHEVELAPDQFQQPGPRAWSISRRRTRHQFTDPHSPEPQVDREIKRALERRIVPPLVILAYARQEALQPGFTTRSSCRETKFS